MVFFEKELNEAINKICDSAYPFKVFLDDGSLLGYLRDKRIIPWDSDIDLSVNSPGFDRLISSIESLSNRFDEVKVTVIDGIPMTVTFKVNGELPISVKRFVGLGDGYFYALTAPMRSKKRFYKNNRFARKAVKKISNFASPGKYFQKNNTQHVYLSTGILSRAVRCYVLWCTPSCFFNQKNKVTYLQSDSLLCVPQDPEKYIERHYGLDWRTPEKDWSFVDDDGTLRTFDRRVWVVLRENIHKELS